MYSRSQGLDFDSLGSSGAVLLIWVPPLGQTTYLLWKLRWMISPLWASVCSSGPSGQAELGRAFQLWYPFRLKRKKNVHWAPPTCQTPSRLWGTMGSCHYGAYILAPMYCEFLRAYEEYTLYFELVYLRKEMGQELHRIECKAYGWLIATQLVSRTTVLLPF